MTELRFSREDIENLAQKLNSLQSQLTKHERVLLLAVFSSASEHVTSLISVKDASQKASIPADLQEQILNAFIPGDEDDFSVPTPRIGIPPPPVSPPVSPPESGTPSSTPSPEPTSTSPSSPPSTTPPSSPSTPTPA